MRKMQEKTNKKEIYYFISTTNYDAYFLEIRLIKKKFINPLVRLRIHSFKLVILIIIIHL